MTETTMDAPQSMYWGALQDTTFPIVWDGEERMVTWHLLSPEEERAVAREIDDYDEAEQWIAEGEHRMARAVKAVNGVPMPAAFEDALAEIRGQRGSPPWPADLVAALSVTYKIVCERKHQLREQLDARGPFTDAPPSESGGQSATVAPGMAGS